MKIILFSDGKLINIFTTISWVRAGPSLRYNIDGGGVNTNRNNTKFNTSPMH
jgi:hypothetical protein